MASDCASLKNTHYNFLLPNMTSSDVLICLKNSPKSKHILFSITNKGKQQISTIEKLEL